MPKSTLAHGQTPQQALVALKSRFGSYAKVAAHLGGFSKAYIRDVYVGRRPASAKLCVALGVPAPQVLAPVCDKCGGRCLPKRCTAIPRKASAPKPFKKMLSTDGKTYKVFLSQAGDVV